MNKKNMKSKLKITYQGEQRCEVLKTSQNNVIMLDCPYTGKGQELSPADLLGSALAGCMLLSMGTLARRNNIDLIGTTVHVELQQTETRIESIQVLVQMNATYSETECLKLERAAAHCKIKASLHPDIKIMIQYQYPVET